MAFYKFLNFFDNRLRRGKPASLYLNLLFRNTALSLAGIFVPLYVFYLTKSLFWVLLYFTIFWGGNFLLTIFVAPLIYHLRFRRSILFSNFILILKFIFLIFAKNNILLLIPAAVLSGLEIIFYWLPYHLIFTEDGAEGGFEEDVKIERMLLRFSSALAPFLGGVLISRVGFPFVYSLAALLIFLSSIPLFITHHHKDYGVPSSKRIIKGLKEKSNQNLLISFFGQGINQIVWSICWPLFAFSILGSYQALGGLTSGAALFSLILLTQASRLTQKGKGGKAILWGGTIAAVLWVFKAFAQTPISLFTFDALQQGAWIFFIVPFSVFMYRQSLRSAYSFEFIIRREIALGGGRVLALFLLFTLFSLGISWVIIFSLGAIGIILATFSARRAVSNLH